MNTGDNSEEIFLINQYGLNWNRQEFISNKDYFTIKLQLEPFGLSGEIHQYDEATGNMNTVPYNCNYWDKIYYAVTSKTDPACYAWLYPTVFFELLKDEEVNRIFTITDMNGRVSALNDLILNLKEMKIGHLKKANGRAGTNKFNFLFDISDIIDGLHILTQRQHEIEKKSSLTVLERLNLKEDDLLLKVNFIERAHDILDKRFLDNISLDDFIQCFHKKVRPTRGLKYQPKKGGVTMMGFFLDKLGINDREILIRNFGFNESNPSKTLHDGRSRDSNLNKNVYSQLEQIAKDALKDVPKPPGFSCN